MKTVSFDCFCAFATWKFIIVPKYVRRLHYSKGNTLLLNEIVVDVFNKYWLFIDSSADSFDKVMKTTMNDKKLLDVNDDCLRSICRQMDIMDLTSANDVCNRLRLIAQETVRLTKPTVNIPLDVCVQKYNHSSSIETSEKKKIIESASRMFRNFGVLITQLNEFVYGLEHYDKDICALITKYCGKRLVALKMHSETMKNLPIEFKPIVQNLRKAEFISFTEIDSSLSEWLINIEHLTLDSNTRNLWDRIFKSVYENLRRIKFNVRTEINRDHLQLFLDEHRSVKHLDLYLPKSVGNQLILPAQIEHLNLHLLYYKRSTFIKTFRSIRNLHNLNTMALSDGTSICTSSITQEIIAGNVQLKHLTLNSIKLDPRLCEVVSKLAYLDTLSLDVLNVNFDQIIRLSPKLRRLSELQLRGCFIEIDKLETIASCFHNLQRLKVWSSQNAENHTFDSESFGRFVTIVQKCNNKIRLDIELYRCYALEIPIDLAQRHRNTFSVCSINACRVD